MNLIKRKLIKCYQEAQYYKKILNNLMHGKRGGYVENARQSLMQYSQKPNGYYEGAVNRQIDEKIDLSIIVPVYNTERYLAECLDSILNQKTTFTYEVICIDDGSPDGSIDILYQYEKKYPIIRVIRQLNRGFSGARNRGLDESLGKYIMFVDSDDRLGENAIQAMMKASESGEYDIVSCGFYVFNEKGEKTKYIESEYETTEKGYDGVSHHQCYFWGKVYKHSFWRNIRLAEGYWFEDMQVLHILSRMCNGYKYIAEPLYEYRANPEGISSTAPAKSKSVDQYWMVEFIEEELERIGIEINVDVHLALLKELGPYLFSRTRKLPDSVRKLVFSAACDKVNSWLLPNSVLRKSDKRLLNAFKKRDFYKWESAASSWHK